MIGQFLYLGVRKLFIPGKLQRGVGVGVRSTDQRVVSEKWGRLPTDPSIDCESKPLCHHCFCCCCSPSRQAARSAATAVAQSLEAGTVGPTRSLPHLPFRPSLAGRSATVHSWLPVGAASVWVADVVFGRSGRDIYQAGTMGCQSP